MVLDTRPVASPLPPRPARRKRYPGHAVTGLKGFAFTAPFFAGFALVFVAPFGYALYQSLYSEQLSSDGLGGSRTVFVGLSNFTRALGDGDYWTSILRVCVFALIQIPVMLGLSLLAALLLDLATGRRARLFRLGLLVPYMIPSIVATLVWLYLYSPRLGPITRATAWFGADVNMFSPNLLWIGIGNLLTWVGIGYNMLIIYGSLRSVPRELFEAARLDGAGELRIAWSIKIPHVRSALVLTGMLAIIHMLQIFAEPLVFRVTSPETVTAGFTPIMMIYNLAFTQGNYNYAAALSVLLAVVVGAVSVLFYRVSSREAL
ncbi:sugar ABC transporter permease [Kineosporia sp. J2-2]|uniref:Sugar ABC transporter permease n=1 Tax=Kineosporia corallincola TaxID=2835133 RepID=A0ABS5TRS4_9ACTN|nr:sugar ABC transporter permease [Kineosporia corallincola]MBT0773495.1 sugar ABC transporter permease [Kineosporia corallincola]